MKKVLVMMAGVLESVPDAVSKLEAAGFELIFNHTGDSYSGFEPFEHLIPDIDAFVLGGAKLDEAFLAKAAKLKIIVSLGSGVEHIPLALARRYDISVANTRGANANAVAELTIGMLICLQRDLIRLNADTKQVRWANAMDNVGSEIRGKKIGLLGFGTVAQSLARKLLAFDTHIFAFDTVPNAKAAEELQVTLCSFDDIIEHSDVISLHLPALKDNKPLIDSGYLARMKDGVVMINTARASLVDTAALVEALSCGKVRAAAVDVYDREPIDPANPLLRLDNVITTPHIGATTYESIHQDCMLCAEAIIDHFAGRTPKTLLN